MLKLRINGPGLPNWPPAPTWVYKLDRMVSSYYVRLPWASTPDYMDRETLRGVAQIPFYYDVCLGLKLCDPLKVYEYFVSRRVFAASKGLLADSKARRKAYKTACRVLETHFNIPRNTTSHRRTTKRKAIRLPLTCPTPVWV